MLCDGHVELLVPQATGESFIYKQKSKRVHNPYFIPVPSFSWYTRAFEVYVVPVRGAILDGNGRSVWAFCSSCLKTFGIVFGDLFLCASGQPS